MSESEQYKITVKEALDRLRNGGFTTGTLCLGDCKNKEDCQSCFLVDTNDQFGRVIDESDASRKRDRAEEKETYLSKQVREARKNGQDLVDLGISLIAFGNLVKNFAKGSKRQCMKVDNRRVEFLLDANDISKHLTGVHPHVVAVHAAFNNTAMEFKNFDDALKKVTDRRNMITDNNTNKNH